MFNVRPDAFWPWFRVRPPEDDPPGFRVAADGSPPDTRPDDFGLVFDPNIMAPTDIGFGGAVRAAVGGGSPFGLFDRQSLDAGPAAPFAGGSLPPYATPPTLPQMASPPLWRGLQGYGREPDARPDTPGFNVKPPADDPPGFRVGADGSARDDLPGDFGLTSFGYDPHAAAPPYGIGSNGATRPAEYGIYPTADLATDPAYLATPPRRDPVQEALDQIARIYSGVGGNPDSFFGRQALDAGPVVTVGGGFGRPLPAKGDAIDPRHIVPVNKPVVPPRGIGDNSRQGQRPGPISPSPPQPQVPQGAPSTQALPDTAGPAAAAAVDAAARERAAAYNTHRKHLQELDPDNPLLKLEPAHGVTPDQATVDSFGNKVKGIVREKVERAVTDLSAQSTYEQRSTVRTVRGQVDLRAEFERLRSGGKRVDGGRGQYGREGELYELPGGVRVGFRMATDMRTGQKRSVPTLDVRYPDGTWVRFHHNNQR
jgi:hypothetical protein